MSARAKQPTPPVADESQSPPARTAYPAGWPAELLERMQPALASALEALVEDYASQGQRLRALGVPDRDEVGVTLLGPDGTTRSARATADALEAAAEARGLRVLRGATAGAEGGCVLALARAERLEAADA